MQRYKIDKGEGKFLEFITENKLLRLIFRESNVIYINSYKNTKEYKKGRTAVVGSLENGNDFCTFQGGDFLYIITKENVCKNRLMEMEKELNMLRNKHEDDFGLLSFNRKEYEFKQNFIINKYKNT